MKNGTKPEHRLVKATPVAIGRKNEPINDAFYALMLDRRIQSWSFEHEQNEWLVRERPDDKLVVVEPLGYLRFHAVKGESLHVACTSPIPKKNHRRDERIKNATRLLGAVFMATTWPQPSAAA
jgi:hypothetical protein